MSRPISPLSAPALGRRALALMGASVLAGGALPAQAAVYNYSFSGYFGNSQGPVKAGKFVGQMTWDTSAGNGTGGWSYWDIINYEKDGNSFTYVPNNRLSSNVLTNAELSNPVLGSNSGAGYNPDAFCFASPLAKGLQASGGYAQSSPGGSSCDGTNFTTAGSGYDPMTYLAVGQYQPDSFKDQGANTVATNYKYFRLQFKPKMENGVLDPSQLELVDWVPGYAQSREWIGLSYLVNAASPLSCVGNNSYPQNGGQNYCPYSGNTQGQTGVRVVTLAGGGNPPDPGPVPDDAPAPLPLFGAGLAFGWSRRIRRRVKRGPVLAPLALAG